MSQDTKKEFDYLKNTKPLCITCKHLGIKKTNSICEKMINGLINEYIDNVLKQSEENNAQNGFAATVVNIGISASSNEENLKFDTIKHHFPGVINKERPCCMYSSLYTQNPESNAIKVMNLLSKYATKCEGYEKVELNFEGMEDFISDVFNVDISKKEQEEDNFDDFSDLMS